jgi:hypothetical protein
MGVADADPRFGTLLTDVGDPVDLAEPQKVLGE